MASRLKLQNNQTPFDVVNQQQHQEPAVMVMVVINKTKPKQCVSWFAGSRELQRSNNQLLNRKQKIIEFRTNALIQ